MYPKSIYKGDSSHVAWSPEEHAARAADGWSDDKPATAAAAADPESTSTDDTASGISEPEPEAPPLQVVLKRKPANARR